MATTTSAISSSAFVSPVVTGGTENNLSNLKAFQLLRTLANTETTTFRESLLDQIYTAPSDNELLSLSPQALDILNGVTSTKEITQPVVNTSNVPPSAANFYLTPLQRENLSSIITQFANAPFDMNTFMQIQNALVAARINPQQISLQGILQQVFSRNLTTSQYGKVEVEEKILEQESAS